MQSAIQLNTSSTHFSIVSNLRVILLVERSRAQEPDYAECLTSRGTPMMAERGKVLNNFRSVKDLSPCPTFTSRLSQLNFHLAKMTEILFLLLKDLTRL